jgi:hypothetical protein
MRAAHRGSSPLEDPMDAIASDRQARLRPEHADRHPSIPVSMWTSAVHLAELVASGPRAAGMCLTGTSLRWLSDEDFEFRGGNARPVNGSILPTRAGEHHISRQ